MKVKTTMRPDEELEVSPEEFADLARQRLITWAADPTDEEIDRLHQMGFLREEEKDVNEPEPEPKKAAPVAEKKESK